MDTQKQEVAVESQPEVAVAGTVVMPASSKDAERLQKLFAGWGAMNAGQRNAFKGMVSRALNSDAADGLTVATAMEIQKWIDENAPAKHHRNGNGGSTPAHFTKQFENWSKLDGHGQAGVKAALTKAIAKAPPGTKEQLQEVQALILAAPSNAKGKAKGSANLAQRYLDEGLAGYKKLSLWAQPARKARVEVERKAAVARGDTELAQKLADLHKQM